MPETIETVDVTPIFNYSYSVEVVKRFAEQLTRRAQAIATGDPDLEQCEGMADYVAINLAHVREALSEIMADDIKQQIDEERFPIRSPLISFHKFDGSDDCYECGGYNDNIVHTL